MRDQPTYPFDICILSLIPYKKYNQYLIVFDMIVFIYCFVNYCSFFLVNGK